MNTDPSSTIGLITALASGIAMVVSGYFAYKNKNRDDRLLDLEKRVDELRLELERERSENHTLRATIDDLEQKMDEKRNSIIDLKRKLGEANAKIDELELQMATMNRRTQALGGNTMPRPDRKKRNDPV